MKINGNENNPQWKIHIVSYKNINESKGNDDLYGF